MSDTSSSQEPVTLDSLDEKLTRLMNNHLPHLTARIASLEDSFNKHTQWAFWTGIATLGILVYMVFS